MRHCQKKKKKRKKKKPAFRYLLNPTKKLKSQKGFQTVKILPQRLVLLFLHRDSLNKTGKLKKKKSNKDKYEGQ